MATDPQVPRTDPTPADTPALTAATYPEIPAWLQELYPFATRTLHLGAEHISFLDEGPAGSAPLLLLHGNPGWSFTFRDVIPQLAESCRVLAPDLAGFGLSSKPRDPRYHTLSRHIENVVRLAEALELQNITLVLHGWGGPIGTGFALAQPHRVRRIVYTNAWAFPLDYVSSKRPPWGVRWALRGAAGTVLDRLLHLSTTAPLQSGRGRAVPDLVVEGYKFPYAHGECSVAVRRFWRMFSHPGAHTAALLAEMRNRLGELTMPVDIVWGREDQLLRQAAACLLHDSFPNARPPQFVSNAGHFVAEDCPEDLAEAILREQPRAAQESG